MLLTINDVIHVGRGFVYDPQTGHLHKAVYDAETMTTLVHVGPQVGGGVFHRVPKTFFDAWRARLSPGQAVLIEHPMDYPDWSTADWMVDWLAEKLPAFEFTYDGNVIAPKSYKDRPDLWVREKGKTKAYGPFPFGENYGLMHHNWAFYLSKLVDGLRAEGVPI